MRAMLGAESKQLIEPALYPLALAPARRRATARACTTTNPLLETRTQNEPPVARDAPSQPCAKRRSEGRGGAEAGCRYVPPLLLP